MNNCKEHARRLKVLEEGFKEYRKKLNRIDKIIMYCAGLLTFQLGGTLPPWIVSFILGIN